VVATVEAYDPAAGAWRSVADLPVPLHHANAAAVNGRLYVAGSLIGAFVADGRVFAYDPDADAWSERTAMPAGSERGAAAVAVLDGRIFVAGGLRGGAVADVSAYDPTADAWAALPPLPEPRDHAAAGAIAGVMYVAGGRGGAIGAHTASVVAFDTAHGAWAPRAPMPTSRGGVAAAVIDGLLLVLGGEGNRAAPSGVFDAVEAYDPAADAWQTLPAMPVPRHGTGAAAIGDAVIVPGGATTAGFGAVDTVEGLRPPAR
jgi:N-acetylneuraminic acid mutarotase